MTANISMIEVPETVKAPETKRYHIGIFERNPPAWSVTIAGVCFQVSTSRYDEAGTEYKDKGGFAELTLEQLQAIKKALKFKVVRWRVKGKDKTRTGAAEVHDTRTNGFRLEPGDEPLAKYLYVEEAPPELEIVPADKTAFADLDKAIEAAAVTEAKVANDPVDKATREKHKEARAKGAKVSQTGDDAV